MSLPPFLLRLGLLGLLGPLALLSCRAAADDGGEAVDVFEEHGARVVLNRSPAIAPGEWRLAARPHLQIGEVDGEEPYLLQRVVHAHTRADGSILVVDAGAASIRIFSPDGSHVRSVGRSGQGPGEFVNLIATRRLPGDTLALIEFPGARISFFDENASFVRVWQASSLPGPSWFLSGERFLWLVSPRAAPAPGEAHAAAVQHVLLGTAATGAADTVATLDAGETVTVQDGNSTVLIRVPFRQADLFAVAPPDRLISSGTGYEIVLRSLDDGSVTRARIAREPRAVTAADWERARADDLAHAARPRAGLPPGAIAELVRARERGYAQIRPPAHMPAFDELHVDALGLVWARGFVPAGLVVEQREWWVFEADGRWLTTVALPADLEVLEIGERHVLGRWTDELGVQRVRGYAFERATRS